MIFLASPWVLWVNCRIGVAQSTNSIVVTAILIVVAVTPRNEAVNGALAEDDADPPVEAVFLSLLHAAVNSAAASRTATADRTRTMVPPTRVVCSAVAENFFDTTHWRRGLH
jgi:hypothetical protein